jgi:uncharacterized membrane protein
MTTESLHISERIDRAADEVYAYAVDPANLPEWAPGLGSAVENIDGHWFVQTPTGVSVSRSSSATRTVSWIMT